MSIQEEVQRLRDFETGHTRATALWAKVRENLVAYVSKLAKEKELPTLFIENSDRGDFALNAGVVNRRWTITLRRMNNDGSIGLVCDGVTIAPDGSEFDDSRLSIRASISERVDGFNVFSVITKTRDAAGSMVDSATAPERLNDYGEYLSLFFGLTLGRPANAK